MIEFFVPGVAVGKGSARTFMNPKTQKAVFTPASKGTKVWQTRVAYWAMPLAPPEPWGGAVGVKATFIMLRPKSKEGQARKFPTVSPDCDKLLRTILDALTKIFYVDDKQVCSVEGAKQYGERPGVLVQIWELERGLTLK